jgi:hypothetical protein
MVMLVVVRQSVVKVVLPLVAEEQLKHYRTERFHTVRGN